MVPGGGTSLSNQSSAAANSGNGDTSTSSADRVSKQFNYITGAAALDASSYLGGLSSGFFDAVKGEQSAEVAKAGTNWVFVAVVSGVSLIGLALVLRGRK